MPCGKMNGPMVEVAVDGEVVRPQEVCTWVHHKSLHLYTVRALINDQWCVCGQTEKGESRGIAWTLMRVLTEDELPKEKHTTGLLLKRWQPRKQERLKPAVLRDADRFRDTYYLKVDCGDDVQIYLYLNEWDARRVLAEWGAVLPAEEEAERAE